MTEVSVVIATYNRGPSLRELLVQLTRQDLRVDEFEVILVDDGSKEPAWRFVGDLSLPYAFQHVRQENTGQAGARQRGIDLAAGRIVVIIDDDMDVPPDFLRRHLEMHERGFDVVYGHIIAPDDASGRALHERFHMHQLERQLERFRAESASVRGVHLCTGNVSFRRKLFLDVGGFDRTLERSEDRELGIRFEKAGARIGFGFECKSLHKSDHASLEGWLSRAFKYGVYDRRIAEKHADMELADPWSFLFEVNPLSRPLLAFSSLAPRAGKRLARAGMKISEALDRIGLERIALKGVTAVYGIEYFRGMRDGAGTVDAMFDELSRYLDKRVDAKKAGALSSFISSVKRDHAALNDARTKYHDDPVSLRQLPADAVKKIGFQMMLAIRLMHLLKDLNVPMGKEVASRIIRHVYGAEIHWDANLAPGIAIVHGNGLVISHAATVSSGAILFHNVTLGESVDAITREKGAPTLESGVHIGPGATLVGPIVVGANSKIMAGAVLSSSIPARSVVKTAPVDVVSRDAVASSPSQPTVSERGARAKSASRDR